MLRRSCFLLMLVFSSHFLFAQYQLSGTVKDQQTQKLLAGASVRLFSLTDSSFSRNRLSDSLGRFVFPNLPADSFLLSVSFVGFKEAARGLRLDSTTVTTDTAGLGLLTVSIALAPGSSKDLATVIVSTSIAPATQKGDTLQINASQFKVNPDATAEDLARKVPGITIENGQVKAQGENVQRVTIDGRELFGDDATAALRNLPAEVIDKIQIFDRLSDQAQFTGVDDGNTTKGINIVTKASMRNGQFGRVFAGYGTEGRYSAGGNSTFFKENRRISVVGNFNNVNQQNFSAQDLLGVTSTAQRGGGGGARGGAAGNRGGARGQGGGFQGGGNFGGSGNFLVGQQNGINRTAAIGINFSDVYAKKLTLTGSYLFNNTGNTTAETSSQQYFTGNVFNQTNAATSNNNNHRLNLRLEWRLDSNNQLIITPNISLQNNEADRSVVTNSLLGTKLRSATTNNTASSRAGANWGNSLLWRHSFAKRGRTFSINLNTSGNHREGDVYVSTLQTRFDAAGNPFDSAASRYTDQLNNGLQLSANLVYTEPLSARSGLQFNYNPSLSRSRADQEAFRSDAEGKYTLFDTALSNRFDNRTRTQNAGLQYRYGDRDNQFSFGAAYQQNTLESDQQFPRALAVNKTFRNILPNAQLRWKISTRSSVRIFYRSATANPSVTQLSDVVDITGRPFISAGNPDLKQQFTNTFNGRYTYTNTGKGLLVVGNLFYQTAADFITNASFINGDSVNRAVAVFRNNIALAPGEQLVYPVNLDGYRSVRSLLTLAFPVKFIKSNFNLNGGLTFSKLPGLINNATNLSNNTTYTAGAVVASNVSQYVDFTVSYTANFSTVENTLQPQLNDSYFQHQAGLQLNLLSKGGWFLQNDLANQVFNGLAAGFNQNFTLWNAAAGKKFLKGQKGELKLSVFDLLGQNQSIVRNVNENFIEDVQNVVLQRYLLLTFTYNLRNFGTAAARSFNREERRERSGDVPRF